MFSVVSTSRDSDTTPHNYTLTSQKWQQVTNPFMPEEKLINPGMATSFAPVSPYVDISPSAGDISRSY